MILLACNAEKPDYSSTNKRVYLQELTEVTTPEFMGSGNFDSSDPLAELEPKFKALNAVGAEMCRMGVTPTDYWSGNRATPEKLDERILMAHKYGITPIMPFKYSHEWEEEQNISLGGYDKWYEIGQAFARRFGPNSEWLREQGIDNWGIPLFAAINEPDNPDEPDDIPREQYHDVMEGLADGVHSVDPDLKVKPGGWKHINAESGFDGYCTAVADLINDGTLDGFDMHHYPKKQAWETGYAISFQRRFEVAKENCGITRDVPIYSTEFNSQAVTYDTREEAAKVFLTLIWDHLGVVGENGTPKARLAFPWNLFHTMEDDPNYGLNIKLSPWTRTARGETLKLVLELTEGMVLVKSDPKESGTYVMKGNGRTLWVWQNRKEWTSSFGSSFTLNELPPEATEVKIYTYKGLYNTVSLGDQEQRTLTGLPTGETLMFLVDAEEKES